MRGTELRARLFEEARRLGFDRAGVAAAGPCRDARHLRRWLAAGRHGTMDWMARAVERRTDPRALLDGARSIVSLLTHYRSDPPPGAERWVGRISRYAWGADYHNVLGRRLRKLARYLEALSPGCRVGVAVDSRPVLEKEWAERSGLGWIGKHSNLIVRDRGSFFFLSELVTDLELPPDAESPVDHCGKCVACLDACPTAAIVGPREVDARRCLSYLTVEHRGAVPRELRPGVGEWIFGCDICQDVCPWNRFAPPTQERRFTLDPDRLAGDLVSLLALGENEFRDRFRGSPIRRAGRDGFLRNVCVALGNRGDPKALPALLRAMREDPSPLVSGIAR
jgi:epoxyqueuosine reductase